MNSCKHFGEIKRIMERRIYEAAVEGSVESLIILLEEDALALDRFMVTCYSDTPLHIASMLGHVGFVEEVLRRKPEIAGALDLRKASPLHLAAAKGYLDIVLKLTSVNPEMCSVCDRDGKNPLHVAAIKGHVNVLRELLRARPQAARILMERRETILHACVNYSQFEAMKLLVETVNDHEFLNSKDEDGNTILHLAIIDKQLEVVKFLTASTEIEVNAVNATGLRALDILAQRKFLDVKDWKMGELLRCAGATRSKGTQLFAAPENEISNRQGDKRKKKLGENGDWLEKKRGALMVVASLISTMTFQAALNPPGGVWQETSEGHRAGRSIMASESSDFYNTVVTSNAIGFVASLSIILLLISGLPFFKLKFFICMLVVIMWIAVTAVASAYIYSSPFLGNVTATVDSGLTSQIVLLVWFGLIALLIIAHSIRFLVKMVKMALKLRKRLIRRCSRSSVRQPLHTV